MNTAIDNTTLDQYRRMFHAACSALGEISDDLGVEPEDGGAEPILEAIAELRAKANRHGELMEFVKFVVREWGHDGFGIELEEGDSSVIDRARLLIAKSEGNGAPAYSDSTQFLHIGDSAFENWYSGYATAGKSDKQRARDAYAAGMGDLLVVAAPAAVAGPSQETCQSCQGNGEIVTDWERYKHPLPGDVGDEAVAECQDCDGQGTVDAAPTTQAAPKLPERDASVSAEQQGLFRKFDVRRADGTDKPGGKHHGCRYFVLDVDHDPCAGAALTAYAAACEATHPVLAADLRTKWGAMPTTQAAPQQEPVAWRHSKTLRLYETKAEVPLADGDEWAEPLCLAAQHPAPVAQGDALNEIVGCIDAANAEGLDDALVNNTDARLADLVQRRLLPAFYVAIAADRTQAKEGGAA